MEVFDTLPLAAVVISEQLGRFFCCHGGLSPELKTLQQIQEIDRFQEPPEEGSTQPLFSQD